MDDMETPSQTEPAEVTAQEITLEAHSFKNPVAALWWGMGSSWRKMWSFAKEHPWKSCGGLVGSVVLGKLLCVYCGAIALTCQMLWVVREKSRSSTRV